MATKVKIAGLKVQAYKLSRCLRQKLVLSKRKASTSSVELIDIN